MSKAILFGKTLIVASILLQAYQLLADNSTIKAFDKNLGLALKTCDCLSPELQKYVQEYLRLAIGAFIASSALILPFNRWSFKLLPLIGLILQLLVDNYGVFTKIPTISILQNTGFWHQVGVIGAIVYLLGVQCISCEQECAKKQLQTEKKKQ